ncbi:hypothetical protein EDC01DRAFT_120706, partial [Geopyxis carbonaria]
SPAKTFPLHQHSAPPPPPPPTTKPKIPHHPTTTNATYTMPATAPRKRYAPRAVSPSGPRSSATSPKRNLGGVLRTRQTASKKARKLVRNTTYAARRKRDDEAAELRKEGEVVMVDVDSVVPSRRQKKLLERRSRAEAENAKTLVKRVEDAKERAEKAAEKEAAAAKEGEVEAEAAAADVEVMDVE